VDHFGVLVQFQVNQHQFSDPTKSKGPCLLDRALVAVSWLNSLALNDLHVAFILNVEIIRSDRNVLLKARETHRG